VNILGLRSILPYLPLVQGNLTVVFDVQKTYLFSNFEYKKIARYVLKYQTYPAIKFLFYANYITVKGSSILPISGAYSSSSFSYFFTAQVTAK